MRLKTLEVNGFKSFSQKTVLEFENSIVCVVGPNGSGKSNVVEAFRFVLGEQSMKSMRGKSGTDLVFKGSKNLPKGTRATATIYFNNTDKVFKLENEGGENINLNYDTISISREVFSDGLNKYILNGTEVRLKDIHNLLASVNIGSSGHHIISQGEADRILNANLKDRREIVEDALGLKIYQYKIRESERKLERTNENMKEVTLLRRENAPHLNFLKKQVEKFEKVKELQVDLEKLFYTYLNSESHYLEEEKSNLGADRKKISAELEQVTSEITEGEEENSEKGNKKIEELKIVEQKANEVRRLKGEIERKLGRIEGMIEMEERRKLEKAEVVEISGEEIKAIIDEINGSIDLALSGQSMDEIKPILKRIKDTLTRFNRETNQVNNQSEIALLKKSQDSVMAEMKEIENEEKKIAQNIETLKQEINKEMEVLRDKEKEKFKFKVRAQELSSALELVAIKEGNLRNRLEAYESEIKQAVALIGEQILDFKNKIKEEEGSPRENQDDNQEDLKRKIERIKIKLEDAGLGNGAEVLKEFEEVSERDNFLAKELEDLQKSMESLVKLIAELKEKIDIEFKQGVKKINVEFQEFFSLMFGGGEGKLNIVLPKKKKSKEEHKEDEEGVEDFEEEEEETEQEGIEINVSLPHKKVKELHALSGGERSLTSIALLFAMSQVNPPPFLVLDETDAALDESNSRKYGDMLEKLSKHSQLIVVTHNRETMSRAGVLYGVTIGSNGASKLLSVKFEEATAIAK
ncbi:MAG: AAA family ATPase [Candidatus Paceibacterota bacterium]